MQRTKVEDCNLVSFCTSMPLCVWKIYVIDRNFSEFPRLDWLPNWPATESKLFLIQLIKFGSMQIIQQVRRFNQNRYQMLKEKEVQ